MDASADERKDQVESDARSILGSGVESFKLASSVDWEDNVAVFRRLMSDAVREAGNPLSIIIDISCLPKRYLLYLLGHGFREDVAARMDFLYSEAGKYEFRLGKAVGHGSLISEGEWTSLQVPYFEGETYVPSRRDLFVSLGGEVSSALPLIERFEADRMCVFGVTGSKERLPSVQYESELTARELLLATPCVEAFEYDLFDVVGMAKETIRCLERPTTCFAIGAKTHALAFGIAALANEKFQVVCRSPSRYSHNNAIPSGRVFVYQVEDRFEPLAYWKPDKS
ncbi:hypothetical protein ACTZWW_08440 [Salinarimonas sp. NSM]|uniref:hypothetical protein n=1 Tax=Salinarimonas sp. NSM TaxID=3458003 RepID=UPI0040362798